MDRPTGENIGSTARTVVMICIVILVFLYLVSPIDLIPDIIPILGWIDDLVVLFIGIGLILNMWRG